MIQQSLQKLHQFCDNENFKGYSLYDSHTGKIPFEKFGHTVSFFSNQVIKRSPVNFRSLIGVPKQYNPKGIGLFLHAYSLLQLNEEKNISVDIDFFYSWLKENYSKGWSGICWGYHYDWPRSDGSMFRAHTPSVVVTAFICRGMMEYIKVRRDKRQEVKEIISSAVEFVLNDVHCTEHLEGLCFSYTPEQRDTVFNANLLAAEILAYDDYLSENNEHQDTIQKVLDFTLYHQNEDGSWYYSLHPKTGKPKKQIDFHQGYMVETIHRICNTADLWTSDLRESVQKGLKFYIKNQFDSDGASLWRYPKKWPVDIHNQSQGIITFSLLSEYSNDYLPFAEKIADWTIKNMQAKNGRFYYQKWPFLTNKVNYMRWNQGWMMVSLAILLIIKKMDQ